MDGDRVVVTAEPAPPRRRRRRMLAAVHVAVLTSIVVTSGALAGVGRDGGSAEPSGPATVQQSAPEPAVAPYRHHHCHHGFGAAAQGSSASGY